MLESELRSRWKLAAGEGGGGRKLEDPAQFFIIVLYHVLQVKV